MVVVMIVAIGANRQVNPNIVVILHVVLQVWKWRKRNP